jgi:hypothetical protein
MLRNHLAVARQCATWNPIRFAENIKRHKRRQADEARRQLGETCRMSIAAATYLLQHVRWQEMSSVLPRTTLEEIVATATGRIAGWNGDYAGIWSELPQLLVSVPAESDSSNRRRVLLASAALYLLQHGRTCYPPRFGGLFAPENLSGLYTKLVQGSA